ncbi:MAG: hypothetical protein JJU15_04815 [Pararhodobacter sp.]|nr:hypothetical protein [Pararhodobacter sp.]
MAIAQMKRIPGTLIVFGFGAQTSFDAYIKVLGGLPERLIVVEPADSRCAGEVSRLAELDGVSQVDGVLADDTSGLQLVEYNMPGLRGFTAPTAGLKALFPGLKQRSGVQARKVGLVHVVPNLAGLSTPLRVRIDLPGAEPEILKILDEGGVLARAAQVVMRCGDEAMFEGGWGRAQLQSWLEARHFRLENMNNEDPDWPELRLKADPASRKAAALEQKLATLKEAHDQVSATAERLAAELQEAGAARDKAATERDEARAALDKAVVERDAAIKARETLTPERDAAVAARDKAMADLGLAMRMQGLLQTDLDDLRARFQQAEAVRKQQEELLRKLTPRLQEAAQQLRQLQLSESEGTDAERLTAKAATATRAKPRATTARKRTTRKKAADAK